MSITDETVLADITTLSNLHGERAALNYRKSELLKSVIPPEVQAEIDAIESEFSALYSSLDEKITSQEILCRQNALALGHTIQNDFLKIEVHPGKVTWDTRALEPLTRRYPWLKDYRSQGNPYTVIKKAT